MCASVTCATGHSLHSLFSRPGKLGRQAKFLVQHHMGESNQVRDGGGGVIPFLTPLPLWDYIKKKKGEGGNQKIQNTKSPPLASK